MFGEYLWQMTGFWNLNMAHTFFYYYFLACIFALVYEVYNLHEYV